MYTRCPSSQNNEKMATTFCSKPLCCFSPFLDLFLTENSQLCQCCFCSAYCFLIGIKEPSLEFSPRISLLIVQIQKNLRLRRNSKISPNFRVPRGIPDQKNLLQMALLERATQCSLLIISLGCYVFDKLASLYTYQLRV